MNVDVTKSTLLSYRPRHRDAQENRQRNYNIQVRINKRTWVRDESQVKAMDNWEDILTNDFYDIEDKVDKFINCLSQPQHAIAKSSTNERPDVNTDNKPDNVNAGGGVNTQGAKAVSPISEAPEDAGLGEAITEDTVRGS